MREIGSYWNFCWNKYLDRINKRNEKLKKVAKVNETEEWNFTDKVANMAIKICKKNLKDLKRVYYYTDKLKEVNDKDLEGINYIIVKGQLMEIETGLNELMEKSINYINR